MNKAVHRQSRNRSKYLNLNENGKPSEEISTRYHRNYVRFRKSSSRSRSRDKSKTSYSRSSIDYRKKLIFLFLQILALFHVCSLIYFHQKQYSFTIQYLIFTLIFYNFLTYTSIQYDTQQIEHGELLLGENILLFLIWYGGIIGGGLGLLFEKHKHLRSQTFTFRLQLILLFNVMWPFLAYIAYMYRNEFSFEETSRVLMSFFEARHQS